jgi:hypothetical protein
VYLKATLLHVKTTCITTRGFTLAGWAVCFWLSPMFPISHSPTAMVTSWFPPVQDIKICELFTYGKNRRVLVFLETCRIQVSQGFLILDPVLYFNIFKIKNRPRKVFKKN